MPQTAGSSVSSVSSTTRKYGLFASCLRSMMLTSSAVSAPVATSAAAATARIAPRVHRGIAGFSSAIASHLDCATFVAKSSRCPTEPWQRTQLIASLPAWDGVPIACTTGAWQRRQFSSAIARLTGVARIGSSNVWVVK